MNGGKKRKKFRTHVFSFIGILAGCLLVFAGYWVMQKMLDKRQDNLLSQGGSLSTVPEELADSGQEEEERSKLTEKELSDILFRDHFIVDAVPHEPYGRQMTMQEAIETGQEWVETFCTAYAFPDENHTIQFEEVSAQLCTGEMGDESYIYDTIGQERAESFEILYQINKEKRGNQLAESMYGYWNINFSGEGIMINLNINSVSGQILRAMMETDPYETDEYIAAMEELPVRKILQDYMDSFIWKEKASGRPARMDFILIMRKISGFMPGPILNYGKKRKKSRRKDMRKYILFIWGPKLFFPRQIFLGFRKISCVYSKIPYPGAILKHRMRDL